MALPAGAAPAKSIADKTARIMANMAGFVVSPLNLPLQIRSVITYRQLYIVFLLDSRQAGTGRRSGPSYRGQDKSGRTG